MNTAIFRFINSAIKTPFLDHVVPVFSEKAYILIPGIIVLMLLLYFGKRHARICVLALALALLLSDSGSEKALKNIFGELRPYAQLEEVNVHRGGKWLVYDPQWYPFDRRQSFAFPSSHAANMAAVAVVLFFLNRRTLWATLPLALAVGFSRVYTGNHFPLDVIGGYAWGACSALIMVKASRWIVKRIWGEEDSSPPSVAPSLPRYSSSPDMASANASIVSNCCDNTRSTSSCCSGDR